ncbi:MAG: hypothetical protein QNK37_16055 [Acidobacteriota bacterium]|nr:hypothetical protein [Acidobacteriota bacterium]
MEDGLYQTRQAHSRWTTQLVLEEMQRQKLWNGRRPSRSALYRFIKAHNLGRDPHREPKSARAFSFDAFGQLWVADFMHGPKLLFSFTLILVRKESVLILCS